MQRILSLLIAPPGPGFWRVKVVWVDESGFKRVPCDQLTGDGTRQRGMAPSDWLSFCGLCAAALGVFLLIGTAVWEEIPGEPSAHQVGGPSSGRNRLDATALDSACAWLTPSDATTAVNDGVDKQGQQDSGRDD
jgi:hypothetical protein